MQAFRRLTLICLTGLASALAACAATDPGPQTLPGNVSAPPPKMDLAGDALLTDTIWKWEGTLLPDGGSTVPAAERMYAIEFEPGGVLDVRADCNRGKASYLLNGAKLTITAISMTKMQCPQGSQAAAFTKSLAAVQAQSFQGKDLMLTVSGKGGTMRFSTPRQ